MSATRRKIAYRIGLNTDESFFKVTVEWLYEMPNPDNPNLPFQNLVKSPLPRTAFTEEELVILERASQCIGDCLERQVPLAEGLRPVTVADFPSELLGMS